MSTRALHILVADDSPSDRLILSALLRRQGHAVEEAADGAEAVARFQARRPDLVLLDVMMPVMDGLAAARALRALAGDDLVPVIFLTALQGPEELAACLEAGGHDFLSKPYSPVVLRAKIGVFARLRQLHLEVQGQREYLLAEQRAAKAVFDRVVERGDLAGLDYRLSPLSLFNGDVLLAARRPNGARLVLLGDFTGHGLSAAIGIMPLAEVFHGMAAKGFALEDILREINAKLKALLPASSFCCATVLQQHPRSGEVELWAGGLPDGVVLSAEGLQRIPSRHLPLGVLAPEAFRYQPQQVLLGPDDRICLWSDGLIESTSPAGEMFGEARLMALLATAPADPLTAIGTALAAFVGPGRAHDDCSLLVLGRPPATVLTGEGGVAVAPAAPARWSCEHEWQAESLRHADPVPVFMHLLMQVPGLEAHRGVVNTILAELCSNALEHGVLGLPSRLKSDADGFRRYYEMRRARLAALTQGWLRVRAEVLPLQGGGLLRLSVQDSGPGFDCTARDGAGRPAYAGRGLALLASLCRRVEYLPPGNHAVAEFAWQDAGRTAT